MNQERYEEHKATIAYGIGHLVRDHEDTPGAVKDYVQPMLEELLEAYENEHGQRLTLDAANNINAERGNEYEAAYEQALETILKLKQALRNIYLTASKATPTEYASALGKVEAAAFIVLDETLELSA